MDLTRLDSEDTIVALATATGPGLRAIVRLAGPGCFSVAGRVLGPLDHDAGFRCQRSLLQLGPTRLPVTVSRFRAGRSYTGQDMLEVSLPGSPSLAEQAVGAFLSVGARLAEPGEFTLRAVLSGRIDLTGAEAVGELIAARGDGQLRAAMQLADGELTRRVARINDALADLLAEVEAGLDFADEPIEFITPARLSAGLSAGREAIAELRRQAGSFETLEHRPTVGLVGRPNAGKSTLMNRLTGVERALCSPLAGTTRDVLTAPLTLADGEALLLDAAGLAAGPNADCDNVDALAQQAARRMAASADLLVIVIDAAAPPEPQRALLDMPELRDRPRVIAVNKVDQAEGVVPRWAPPDAMALSAVTGQGLPELKSAVNAALFAGATRATEEIMLNARHRAALADADAALVRAIELLGDPVAETLPPSADLLAGELREAINHLGQISGQVMVEDVLGRIFSRFCLGK